MGYAWYSYVIGGIWGAYARLKLWIDEIDGVMTRSRPLSKTFDEMTPTSSRCRELLLNNGEFYLLCKEAQDCRAFLFHVGG